MKLNVLNQTYGSSNKYYSAALRKCRNLHSMDLFKIQGNYDWKKSFTCSLDFLVDIFG